MSKIFWALCGSVCSLLPGKLGQSTTTTISRPPSPLNLWLIVDR